MNNYFNIKINNFKILVSNVFHFMKYFLSKSINIIFYFLEFLSIKKYIK